MKDFMDYCKKLNERCVIAQSGCKETVTEETAVKAIYIVKKMRISSLSDALLYGAALNVLNTYVKQDNGDKPYIGYFFKQYANGLAQYLVDHCAEGMDIELQNDRGMTLLVVNLFGIQCSFHRVKLNGELDRIKATDGHVRIGWDGVRKQRCANTFFNGAIEYVNMVRAVDKCGGNLLAGMNAAVERYNRGEINIKRVG